MKLGNTITTIKYANHVAILRGFNFESNEIKLKVSTHRNIVQLLGNTGRKMINSI